LSINNVFNSHTLNLVDWPGKDKVNFGQIDKEVGIVEQQLKPTKSV